MKIEYDPRLPQGSIRFNCKKCGSRWIAEKDGEDYFIKNNPRYLGSEYISYCPCCGQENKQY